MVLIKKEIILGIPTYYVDKDVDDNKADEFKNTFVKSSQIKLIINDDADVYTFDEKLLLRFRKNKLTKNNISKFYDNIIDFATTSTSNRGSASGSKNKNITENPKIMTNIFGFFDTFSPRQKMKMKTSNIKLVGSRPCRFNIQFPEKYKNVIPLIEEVDKLANYKKPTDNLKSSYPTNTADKQNNLDQFIIVKTGETLSILAVRYHISVQDLKLINGLKSDFLKVGQKLKIRK